MSENTFESGESGSEFRKKFEEQQARLKEIEAENATLRTERDTAALASVLSEQKFRNPARVQADILKDGINPTDAKAVAEWLQTNGDDYGRDAGAQAAVPNAQAQAQAGISRIDAAQQAGNSAGGTSNFDAVAASLPPNATADQVAAAFQQAGI